MLVDAGASAGLNLLYDRYRLELGDHGVWGDPQSPVVCSCVVAGQPPAPDLSLVDVPLRVGLDRSPVDVIDPVAARWLLACTWPDTGRLERARAAIELAASMPPDVRTGDLVTAIGPLLASLSGDGPVCVVTSWTFGYLDAVQRTEFLERLAHAGRSRPIAWLNLDHSSWTPELERPAPRTSFAIAPSFIDLTVFRDGAVDLQRPLAHVHPHGSALEWIA